MTNFAFGKTGLQLRFNFSEKSENFKSADHCKLLINLAYNNPKDNFYIIGQNNLNKIDIELKKKLFPHNNVYNTSSSFNIMGDQWTSFNENYIDIYKCKKKRH